MVAHVVTVAFEGVEARRVDVEVQLTGGEVLFVIGGLANKAVAESRERVHIAEALIYRGRGPEGDVGAGLASGARERVRW